LSAEHRQAAGVKAGDQVEVTIELDSSRARWLSRTTWHQPWLKSQARRLHSDALSFTMRKEYVRQVETAKAQETRERRISKIVASLAEG